MTLQNNNNNKSIAHTWRKHWMFDLFFWDSLGKKGFFINCKKEPTPESLWYSGL